MIYKSYILEQNVNSINEKIALFYVVNLGLKNDLKAKIIEKNKNSEILRYSQDEILKDKALLENEIKNISLFEKNKIFFIENVNDKILETIQGFENTLSDRKIFLFSDVLDKKSKLRNYTEKSKNCASVACYEDNEISLKRIIQQNLRDFQRR